MSMGADDRTRSEFSERLEKNIERVNSRYGKPYRISLTSGTAYFRHDGEEDIEKLLSEADRELYEKKKKKRGKTGKIKS